MGYASTGSVKRMQLPCWIAPYSLKMSDIDSQMQIEIRPCAPEDTKSIADIFIESAAYHVELDPERYSVPDVEVISARYRERQHPADAHNEATTYVAECSGEIIGFIDVQLDRSPDAMHKEMTYCHISEIAVRNGHQNQGIGGRLLEAAEEWGRKMGAEFASLEFHTENTRASLFYQGRMGYRPASITAIKRL
jgi:ribosomal protein S18 acetylase RimI-like enzyme